MANFSDIPTGIARKIALEHLDHLDDLENFKEVCSSWRSDVRDVNCKNFCPSKNIQLPWLMLADPPTSSYRRFYNLSKGMFRKIDLPRYDDDPKDHRRYFSSKGWLIGVSRNQGLISFFDPFSGNTVKPPSVPFLEFLYGDEWDDEYYLQQFSKFVFSTRPTRSSSSGDDLQVAMIFNTCHHLAFWRPGQQDWIKPDTDETFENFQIEDVCFFRGTFYSIDIYSKVVSYDGNRPRIVAKLDSQGLGPFYHSDAFHIVGFDESALLVIYRSTYLTEDSEDYGTESFKLFEVNVNDGKARRVEGIGDRALFVGYNSTFFVEASSGSDVSGGCRPNSIYFSDNNQEYYSNVSRGGGIDMGIYSLEENKVVGRVYEGPSQFSFETPPLWVELPHCQM